VEVRDVDGVAGRVASAVARGASAAGSRPGSAAGARGRGSPARGGGRHGLRDAVDDDLATTGGADTGAGDEESGQTRGRSVHRKLRGGDVVSAISLSS